MPCRDYEERFHCSDFDLFNAEVFGFWAQAVFRQVSIVAGAEAFCGSEHPVETDDTAGRGRLVRRSRSRRGIG